MNISDHADSQAVAGRLKLASKRIHDLAEQVGMARTVREFATDMRKNLLAKYVVRGLKAGETAVAAESIGRADPEFQRELEALQAQYEAAEKTIARWNAEQVAFDAARSLLSFEKATMVDLA